MLVSPYKDVTQYTKIQIKPHMMNSDIQNIMKLVLRKKVEKRCNKNGFVDEVHRIETFEAEDMRPENLSGAVNFDISYHCRLCIPIENSLIFAQVKAINQELILAQNGPVMIFIPKDNIDQTVWDVTDKFMHMKDKTNLKVNNYIKVEVMNKRINQGDHQIKIIGQLLDLASEDEINNYYGSIITLDSEQIEEVEEQEESNFII